MISMNFAIQTENPGRIYKIRGGKKTEPKDLVPPLHFPTYLLGRGVARFINTTLSVLVTIVFGMLFLRLRIDLAVVDWILFIHKSGGGG